MNTHINNQIKFTAINRFLRLVFLSVIIIITNIGCNAIKDNSMNFLLLLSGSYTNIDKISTPRMNPTSQNYEHSSLSITITVDNPSDTIIYYTLDGNEPDELSSKYTTPIVLNSSKTVKAKAYRTNWLPSDTASGTFNIFPYKWTNTFGYSSSNNIYTAVDSLGNIYISGCTDNAIDFDPSVNTDIKGPGYYLTKTNIFSNYQWTKINCPGITGPIATDSSGNIYGPYAKLDSEGNTLWYLSSGDGIADSIALNSSNDIFITGSYSSTIDFDPTITTDFRPAVGNSDIFISKINNNATYGWTRTIGGTNSDRGYGIATDSIGNVYVAGYFANQNIDFRKDWNDGFSDNKSAHGTSDRDAFIMKINHDSSYGWTKVIGSSFGDIGRAVAIDKDNNIIFVGEFGGTVNFREDWGGTDTRTSQGSSDVFILKIMSDGSYGWVKVFGGNNPDEVTSVTTDNDNNIYLTGGFCSDSINFRLDWGGNSENRNNNGVEDLYILKLKNNGDFSWVNTFGGNLNDFGKSVKINNSSILVTGVFASSSVDFNPSMDNDIRNNVSGCYESFYSLIGLY